jgi:hypothetical protein
VDAKEDDRKKPDWKLWLQIQAIRYAFFVEVKRPQETSKYFSLTTIMRS